MENKYTPMLVLPTGSHRRRRAVKDVKSNKSVQQINAPSQSSPLPPVIIPVQSEGYIHPKRFDRL